MQICPNCGEENPEGFRFCGMCGASLTREQALPAQQRRVVSVLFCDVVGSTSLGEQLDPEALRLVLARYFTTVRAVIEQHNGNVEKFIGDAALAIFSSASSAQDAALNAVHAGRAITEAITKLNDELDTTFGKSIQVRVGISSGEVVAATSEGLATGDPLNMATLYEAAAPPGEVLFDQATFDLVGPSVEVQIHAPIMLAGKGISAPAYQLLSVRQSPQTAQR